MAQQIFLLFRMLAYPAFGAVVFDGYTAFDPETGVYSIQVGQVVTGLIGYALTFVSSRFAAVK